MKRSLYLLAGTCGGNGLVNSDAYERPSPRSGACRILDYTAIYAATVLEYLEASGDEETARDLWPLCVLQTTFVLNSVCADGVFRDSELYSPGPIFWLYFFCYGALLLSGFTDQAGALLLGVDVGGLGTPIASLASLIAMKLYSHSEHASTGKFLLEFTAVNLVLLALLSLAAVWICL